MTKQEFLDSIKLDGEEWRDVVGYENLYSISSLGRVVSHERYVPNKRYSIIGYMKCEARLLKILDRPPYYAVSLSKDGKVKNCSLHRLIAEAFIPNPDNKPCVDHIDTNSYNNAISNLRWATIEENVNNKISKVKRRTSLIGRDCSFNFKPVCQLLNGKLLKVYASVKETANDGFAPKNVSATCRGRARFHAGFEWMYLSDYETLINKSKNSLA